MKKMTSSMIVIVSTIKPPSNASTEATNGIMLLLDSGSTWVEDSSTIEDNTTPLFTESCMVGEENSLLGDCDKGDMEISLVNDKIKEVGDGTGVEVMTMEHGTSTVVNKL